MVSMICEDMRYFRTLGIQGISSDQWGPGWYPLNMYAFAKLSWNPELTHDQIIHDFCTKHYGRAAETMEAYWNALEEGLRESWTTTTPIDWRDAKRLELAKKALAEASDRQTEARVRDTARLHQLALPEDRTSRQWVLVGLSSGGSSKRGGRAVKILRRTPNRVVETSCVCRWSEWPSWN